MHPLLQRQLAKYFGNQLPSHPEMDSFLEAISASYVKDDIKNKTIDNIFQLFKEETNVENANIKHAINESSLSAILDKSGKIISINKKLEILLNLKSEDITNRYTWDVLSNDQHSLLEQAKDLLLTGKTWQGEIRYVNKNGQSIWLEGTATPMINPNSKKTAYLLLFNDITTRKIYEQEIIKSEKKNRDLINYSQAIICTHDMSGVILSMNPAGCEILEYDANELIGKRISDFIPEEHRVLFQTEYLSSLQHNSVKEGILKILSKSNNRLSLLYKNYKVTAEGQEDYVIAFSQDITKRLLAENELKKAKNAAEESNRIKELFLANMSHEIKTPMNGIVGLTKLLLKSPLNDQQHKYADSVKQSAENLLLLFNDIFDFSKLKEGRSKLRNAPFDLSNIYYNLNHTFKSNAQNKKIELISFIDDEINPFLIGDANKLNQVLMHLISNAIKFTSNGKIIISADLIAETSSDCHIRFSVSDTGIGIQSSKLKSIFEAFTQANDESSRLHGGLGLGLTIVKDLLTLMNSTIQLESEYEKGSTFSFELLLEKSNPNSLTRDTSSQMSIEGTLKGVKILIAEDNRVNQLFASELMTEWGASYDIADNGQIAIELYNKKDYDLILMDIQMPILDGIDATHIIRNQFPTHKQNIPIIAITANAKTGDEEKFREYGMNEVVFKPYSSNILYHLIKRLLDKTDQKSDIKDPGPKVTEPLATLPDIQFEHASLHVLQSFSRGKESFIVKMLQAIIDTIPPTIKELNHAIQQGDWISVNKCSHKLIPNMNMSGNSYLETEMKWIENNANEEQAHPEIIKKWPMIKLEVEKTLTELKKADTFYKIRTFNK
ncbi:MAG: PAS domain S-box protein [Bacteroidia bacterium]